MFTYVNSDKIDFQYDQPHMLHINKVMNLRTSRSPSSGLEIPNWGKWLWKTWIILKSNFGSTFSLSDSNLNIEQFYSLRSKLPKLIFVTVYMEISLHLKSHDLLAIRWGWRIAFLYNGYHYGQNDDYNHSNQHCNQADFFLEIYHYG